MIILGAAALISFLVFVSTEIEYYIGDIWENDNDIRNLREELDELLNLLKSKENLSTIDCIHSGLPLDWLDQLENCIYDIEDIQVYMELEEKKKIVAKFLEIYIKYVHLICTGPASEDQIMDAENSNTQCYERFYELGSSREDIKSQIVEELISTTMNSTAVRIVGMGGLGKTILARAIADEELIARNFPIIFTPPQSFEFNSKRVIDHIKSNHPLCKDERALILLDGVHQQILHPEKFLTGLSMRRFQQILHPESKLLITTQNQRIAVLNGTCTYRLPLLPGEDCFSFIYKLANGNGNLNEEDKVAIIKHKRELIDTSKGLPLLASQIGSLLAAEAEGKRLAMIKKITGRNPWEVAEFRRVLLKLDVVSLIVRERNLRRCLAYCSLFPPDHEFEQDDLVHFWMAEGFAQTSTRAHLFRFLMADPETMQYLDKLLSYSIFGASALHPAQQPRYRLHRLYYDLALNLASKTFCQIHIHKLNPNLEISDITRHISVNCDNGNEIDMDHFLSDLHSSCGNLRTFLFINNSGQNLKKNPTFFKGLTRLRVLDLSYTNLTTLNKEDISNLTYLRYLDLSFTPITKLPQLSKSPKLEVLKLNHCAYLRDSDLTLMTNLISLEVSGLDSMPSGIGKLIKLQRLDVFIVGQSDGFKITELSNLNYIRKSLRIKKLENVESKQEAEKAMLRYKEGLERLELEWTTRSTPYDEAEQVLEGLHPPERLKELTIINYCGDRFPKWLNDTKVCGFLVYIHLQGCKPLPGQRFPFVETLVLRNMEELDMWIDLAANRIPHLLNLRVDNCMKLRVLPPLDRFKSLEKLEVIWCPKLEELPTLPQSLTSLIVENNDNLKARCQTGGADRHKIRHIIEVVINSEPVDTSEPDLDASTSAKGKPNEDKIISPHLLHRSTTKNETKLKAPIDKSEPHSSTAGHTSSDIEVVTDSTPADTSEPDSAEAGHTSSGIEVVLDSTPVDTSEPVPTTASHIFEDESPMSIFFLLPKDHEIEEDTLIQLWMAAEYINDEQQGIDLFKRFFKIGYLLHCGSNFMTGMNRYRINTQMINELRINQKDKANCYLQWKKDCINIPAQSAQSILHVSLLCNAEINATTFKTLEKCKDIRTLLFLVNPDHRAIQIPSQLLSSFKELRTLDLSRTYMKEFPSSIGQMIQLRYLDLSWTLIKWLPDVLCSLTQLQTLKLRGCSNLTILPKRMSQLTKLRHLDVDVLGQIEAMPKGIGALEELRTLPTFLVGTDEGCKLTELTELNNLSGEICIANLENEEYDPLTSRPYLKEKLHLQKLELRWTESEICGKHQNSSNILALLEPPPNLEELQIMFYEDAIFPSWMGGQQFHKLAHIKLYMCENLIEIPQVELFPTLKHLELVGLNKVKSINLQREDGAFPKLEKLEISEMQILRDWKWQESIKGSSFKSLTHLIIDDCPELEEFDVLSHLSAIKYFEISECPKLLSLSDGKRPHTLEELIVDDCPQI